MKKKFVSILAAALLVFGTVGQALAFFEENDLIRVVYHRGGTVEVGTDLSSGTAIQDVNFRNPFTTQYTLNSNNFSLGQFAGATFADLYVAYFIKNDAGGVRDAWVSGPEAGLTSGSRKWGAFSGVAGTISTYYNSLGSAMVSAAQAWTQSYWYLAEGNGVKIGSFNEFTPLNTVNANLAALATVGYVDQFLYFFDSPDSVGNGVKIATIRTMADGSTIINAGTQVVPIPGAVWLLGTGLLGLIGLRRRQA